MAKGVNSVFLLGYIGKAPEVRTTQSGTVVTTMSMATSDSYKNKDGEFVERVEWHNVVAYARAAEILRDYAKKGDQIHIEGRIHNSNWDDKESGQKRYKSEVVVNSITLLGGKRHEDGGTTIPGGTPVNDYADQGISDEDIPF